MGEILNYLHSTVEVRVPVAPAPVTVDGTPLLLYELHLTSFAWQALVLRRVEALDADTGAPVGEPLDDPEDLDRRLSQFGAAPDATRGQTVAPGTHRVLYVEMPVAGGGLPRALAHRLTFRPLDSPTAGPDLAVSAGRTPVRTEPPVVLGPPLRGGPWAAVHHPGWAQGHRRFIYAIDGRARIPGRFAVDWMRLDAEGRTARGDTDAVANWYGYGADVLAVADAVVVATRDDVPESGTVSGHPQLPLADSTGNYVALDLGGARYAYYEHLRPGLRCRPGDRLRRGQVIGSLGFTGHTVGPHLHFHVGDAASPLAAEGVPFVLDTFDVRGGYDGADTLGSAPWQARSGEPATRRHEFPGSLAVIDFREG